MKNGPLSIIIELTHACPLACVYCSNPLELTERRRELPTEAWLRTIIEAADMGVAQISFTGGEPFLYADLPVLVRAATELGLYTNVITSGVGVTQEKLNAVVENGCEHIQLSFQDSDREGAKKIARVDALDKKLAVAAMIAKMPVAFTVNLVIHRENHARLEEMMDMAVNLGATKIEVAHVQFNGWALKNRGRLMPSRPQVQQSMEILERKQKELLGKVRVDYVLPDYYARTPKPCMGGWGKKMMVIDPKGQAAPCHSAQTIPGFTRPSIGEYMLKHIWSRSKIFQAFRGNKWMEEPCRTCDKREQDFGGCRCQAMALVGRATAADPVCYRSPDRAKVDRILKLVPEDHDEPLVYRLLVNREYRA